MGSSQNNILVGRKRHGFGQYFMGTGLLFMFASSLSRMNHKPYVVGSMAILWGWISSWLKRVPRYDNPEFRTFLRSYQWNILFKGKKRVLREMSEKV